MIMMGIGLVAGVFYWLGGLGIVRGDNQTRLIYRGDSEIAVAVLMPVAWHIGGLAGYL